MSILERGLAFQVLSLHSTAIPAEGPGLRIWRGQRKGLGGGWGGKDGEERGRESAGALSFPVLHHKPTKQHGEFLKSIFKLC